MAENQLGAGQQYLILPEGSTRILGREAQRTNIAVGYAVASVVKTTLGPKGMDKMLVSELGDIVITNDGATILEEMNVEHPIAKIMVDIAKTQDKEVGDGTTTAVIIAGELLKAAGNLIEQGIHPTIIIKGYKMAAEKAMELLREKSFNVSMEDEDKLEKIAMISLGSKNIGGENTKRYLSKLAIQAIKQVATKEGNKITIDHDFIKIEKKEGGGIEDRVHKRCAYRQRSRSSRHAKVGKECKDSTT